MTDDAALLAQAQAGDTDAAAALVTRHAARVVRYARSLCGSGADADDAAQDALLAAYHAIGQVRSAEALPSWLYAVARGACAKLRRKQRPEDPLDEAPATGRGPEEHAAGHEVAGALTQALRTLDPKYREVVWLRDVEGLTAPEVADALDLEVAAVKTRLHRGRTQLRAKLEPVLAATRVGPACPDILERFSSYLEGDIGPAECDALKHHVDTCASCNAACEALKRTVGACNAQAAEVPPEVQDRVRRALLLAIGKI